ncbi:hypothetical protein HHI36_014576 [Cryptolaemus montrouzieri]|uniref:Uncharacterized protein n=1 Tax=Cryptolaemus montrouzieri TaxID=559131 RepID=A0ABD2N3H9_9CUCU
MAQKLQVNEDLSNKNDILYYRDLNEKNTNTFIENLNKRYRRLRKQYKNAIDSEIRRTHSEKIKSSANPQRTTWRVMNTNIKKPKFKDMDCTITADDFNNVSKLLTPTVADTKECMKYVRNINSADYGSMFLEPIHNCE